MHVNATFKFLCVLALGSGTMAIASPGNPASREDGTTVFDFRGTVFSQFVDNAADATTTPDKEPCVRLHLPAERITHYLQTHALSNAGALPPWDNVSIWIKPDDSETMLRFTFHTAGDDGKERYHVYHAKMLGTAWKQFTFDQIQNGYQWSNVPDKTRADKLKGLTIIADAGEKGKATDVLLGPLLFHPPSDKLALAALPALNATPTKTTPALDGKLDDSCWKDAAAYTDFLPLNGKKVDTELKITYDEKSLYVGAVQRGVDPAKLRQEQKTEQMNVWQDDAFEFFLGPHNDSRSFYQFIVNALNVKQGLRTYFDQVKDDFKLEGQWGSGVWRSAVSVGEDTWSFELEVPFAAFIPKVAPGDIVGLQCVLPGARLAQTSSNPDASNFATLNMRRPLGPDIAIGDVTLSLSKTKTVPEVAVSLPDDRGYDVTVSIASPSGKVASANRTMTGKGALEIKDYIPESGSQRLTVAIEAPGFSRTVKCFKSTPVIFAQPSAFEKNILCPEPKTFTEGEGEWRPGNDCGIYVAADADTGAAERLREDLAGYLGVDAEIIREVAVPSGRILITNAPGKLAAKALQVPESHCPGAYCLRIAPDGVSLAAKDAEGMAYAAATLAQLERYAFLRNESHLRETVVDDFPNIGSRIAVNWFQGLTERNTESSHAELLDYYKTLVSRHMASHKMNAFSLMFQDAMKYDRPLNKKVEMSPKAMFLDIPKLKELNRFCAENHVEFIPALAGPSHCLWITLAYPQLAMPGYSNWDANPTDEEYFKVYFSVMDEIIDAIHPKSFHTWNDEWWHQSKGGVSSTYNGKEKRDIFMETIERVNTHLKEKNVVMHMFSDMLQREHNGGLPYNNYLNADKLPKDITMMHWSGGKNAARTFRGLGYRNLITTNRFSALGARNEDKTDVDGYGVITYATLSPEHGYGYFSLLRAADYGWNFGDGNEMELSDWIIEKGRNVIANASVNRNPAAARSFRPLDISNAFNASWNRMRMDAFPGGAMNIGFVPMEAGDKGARTNCAMATDTEKIEIPVNGAAASLIFLHAFAIAPDDAKEFVKTYPKGYQRIDGTRMGSYHVVYADGTTTSIPLRSAENIGCVKPYAGRTCAAIENTYLRDCRFTWEPETPSSDSPRLYQCEWVNPHPEKTIAKIELAKDGYPKMTPMLFAVTARDCATEKK